MNTWVQILQLLHVPSKMHFSNLNMIHKSFNPGRVAQIVTNLEVVKSDWRIYCIEFTLVGKVRFVSLQKPLRFDYFSARSYKQVTDRCQASRLSSSRNVSGWVFYEAPNMQSYLSTGWLNSWITSIFTWGKFAFISTLCSLFLQPIEFNLLFLFGKILWYGTFIVREFGKNNYINIA